LKTDGSVLIVINIFYMLGTAILYWYAYKLGGCYGRDCMVVGFTTTCAISAYHH